MSPKSLWLRNSRACRGIIHAIVVFHARFARQLGDIGYRIERTAKGWELAGVPQRVLDEFSRRTEQVEQKAKESGITSAKEKDGLAALTRERKQKQLSKSELREL